MIFLEKTMSARWSDGDSPLNESAISGRTAALAPGDRMTIGIPWISRDQEIICEADLTNLLPAIAKVSRLVSQ